MMKSLLNICPMINRKVDSFPDSILSIFSHKSQMRRSKIFSCLMSIPFSSSLSLSSWFQTFFEKKKFNSKPLARFYSNRIFSRRTNQHTHQQLQHPEYEIGDGIFRIFLKNINLKFQGVYG